MTNIVKQSYRVRRLNQEIYNGFGFDHLSDATNYYVHKNNQSYNGTTSLSQAIGEAISLYTEVQKYLLLPDYSNYANLYIVDASRTVVRLYLKVQPLHKVVGLFPKEAALVQVECDYNKRVIRIRVEDENHKYLGIDEYTELLLGNLALFAAYTECAYSLGDDSIITAQDFEQFQLKQDANLFVRIHENYYQDHKEFDYKVDVNIPIDFSRYVVDVGQTIHNKLDNQETEKGRLASETISFSGFEKRFIPQLGDSYTPFDLITPIGNAIVAGDALSVLFYGPSGTGKTIACKQICEQIQLPILATINCTENLDEFVLGKFIPVDDKIIFRESEVSKAIRNGGAVVFEEINFARPSYLAFLNSLLDSNGFVRLDNGELIRRHKDFRFFATMNLGYYGTKELNQSLFNRFNIVYELKELTDTAIRHLLVHQVPSCEKNVDTMIEIYHRVRSIIQENNLNFTISVRNLENWANLAKHCGYAKAAELTLASIAHDHDWYKEVFASIATTVSWNYD